MRKPITILKNVSGWTIMSENDVVGVIFKDGEVVLFSNYFIRDTNSNEFTFRTMEANP